MAQDFGSGSNERILAGMTWEQKIMLAGGKPVKAGFSKEMIRGSYLLWSMFNS